jgi:hypothetical protein
MHITQGDTLDPVNQPQNIDISIIRNPSMDVELDKVVASLTDSVKEGGYVLASAWGNSAIASELQVRYDMKLIGYFARHEGKQTLVQSNLDTIQDNLIKSKDELFGVYPGRNFVFQKIKANR